MNFIKKVNSRIIEYIKFNIIGTTNFLVSQLVYIFLYLALNINYILAYSIVSVLSITAAYFLNSRYTFNDNSYSTRKFSLVFLLYVFEYVVNLLLIIFMVDTLSINELIAPLIAPVISTPPVYFLMRYIIKK